MTKRTTNHRPPSHSFARWAMRIIAATPTRYIVEGGTQADCEYCGGPCQNLLVCSRRRRTIDQYNLPVPPPKPSLYDDD